MKKRKEEIITFKVDEQLAAILSGVENRSAFIREAILSSLGSSCPVCGGSGILSQAQQKHWNEFLSHHHIEECTTCNEPHMVCEYEKSKQAEITKTRDT